jgi:hypothetical protein
MVGIYCVNCGWSSDMNNIDDNWREDFRPKHNIESPQCDSVELMMDDS